VDVKGDSCIIPPTPSPWRNLEYFQHPRNGAPHLLGKSTYARCGSSSTSRRSSQWRARHAGFSNTTRSGKIYANEGVAQVILIESDESARPSYKDRAGITQDRRA